MHLSRRSLFILLNASTAAVLAAGVVISDNIGPWWTPIPAAATLFVIAGMASRGVAFMASKYKITDRQVNILIGTMIVLVGLGCIAGALIPLEGWNRGPTTETTRGFSIFMLAAMGWILSLIAGPVVSLSVEDWKRLRPRHCEQPC